MSDIKLSFANINLHPRLAQSVTEMGYVDMTPIQQQAIPEVLNGKDVMGVAQTGTGKTAAFALPLLQKMMANETDSVSPARHPIRALVLAPTRELADQVAKEIKKYAKHTKLRCAVVFGGVDMKPQSLALRAGVDVLVATPGRLLDHIESKNIVFNQVEFVVLDEADRMLDIGFLPDLQRILSYLPKQRTTLLFSATFSTEIKKLANGYLNDPVLVEVARATMTAKTVEQRFYSVSEQDKRHALQQLLKSEKIEQSYIFTNSKQGCARLAIYLERCGLKVAALHGNKTQDERLKVLQDFKDSAFQFLVATDVAARGLDIKDVPAVFNFDLPFNAEDYVHRIGRTGRAGAKGLAISFVNENDQKYYGEIKKLIKQPCELLKFVLTNNSDRDKAPIRQQIRQERTSASRDDSRQQIYKPRLSKDPIFNTPYKPENTLVSKANISKNKAELLSAKQMKLKRSTSKLPMLLKLTDD